MTGGSIDEMQVRLDRIESQIVRLQRTNRALILLIAVAACVGAWAARSAQALRARTTLEARELVIVDKGGTPRVRMGTDGALDAFIKVRGAFGNGETLLLVDPNGRSFLTMANGGHVGLSIGLAGGPSIALSGGKGNTGLSIWVTGDGLPSLRLGNTEGSPRIEFNLLDREGMEQMLQPRPAPLGCMEPPTSDRNYMHRDPTRPEFSYAPHVWLLSGQRASEVVPGAFCSSTEAIALSPPPQQFAAATLPPEVQRLSPGDVPPQAIDQPKRWVSATTERFRLSGEVILQLIVGEDGSVMDAIMLKSLPLIGAEVVEAARKWRYKPATRNGKPIVVYHGVWLKVGCPCPQS